MKLMLQRNRRILCFARLGVALGLIVYLIWIADWERVARTIGEADNSFLLIVSFFSLLARLGAAAFRWQLILADSKVRFYFWHAYTGYLVGAFYNALLPGVAGGDAIRIGRCVRQTKCQLGTAAASVLFERCSGIFVLGGIAISVYLLFPEMLSSLLAIEETSSVTVVATVGVTFMAATIFGRRVWLRWLSHEDARGVWDFVRSAMQTLSILRGRTLIAVFILSILFQAIDIVVTFFLSQAIGLTVPLIAFFAVIPLAYLAICLPISLGGLGVREGTLVFLLAQFGVVASDAVALSLLVYLNRVVIASLGGLIQLVETFLAREADRTRVEDANVVDMPRQELS